jgi:Core-2/I-Branching enzyme
MAKRTVFSKQNLVITSSIFVFYFLMKILILATTDSTWDYRAASRTSESNTLLTSSYLQYLFNGTNDSNMDNETCEWDALGVPGFIRAAGCNGRYCNSITCKKLLSGDTEAILAAADFTKLHRRKVLMDDQVLKFATNCSELYLQGRYQRVPLRPSDIDFPIAFNILVHMQAEQLERLLRAIYRPQNVYCIHVDAKASWTFHAAVEAIAKCFDNVFVATRRQRIVYAGFSRLQVNTSKYLFASKIEFA